MLLPVKKPALKKESLKSSDLNATHSESSAHSKQLFLGLSQKSALSELFYYDCSFFRQNPSKQWIIGVDEVGRGPLAGPVTACAVAISKDYLEHSLPGILSDPEKPIWQRLNDSKKLSAKNRSSLFDAFLQLDPAHIRASIFSLSPGGIDKFNILAASLHAMQQCLLDLAGRDQSLLHAFDLEEKLGQALSKHRMKWKGLTPIVSEDSFILIDGTHIPLSAKEQKYSVEAVKKGDSRSFSIALASVLAKQQRDAMMQKAASIYPNYGFEKHMGYGTKKHLEALHAHGPCPLHRMSFAPVRDLRSQMDPSVS